MTSMEPPSGVPHPAVRLLPLSAAFNFRDLGGYQAADLRFVRRGRLFRSDLVASLGRDDRAQFEALGIRTVVDLRSVPEARRRPALTDVEGLRRWHFPLRQTGYGWDAYDPAEELAPFIAGRYLDLAITSYHRIVGALRVLLDPSHWPLLMHCHVGRDRTGVLAALTLALLGVPDGQIADDYALSAEAERRYQRWHQHTHPSRPLPPPHLVATPHDAMRGFLAGMRERFGSVEEYVRRGGIASAELASFRSHILVKEP